MTHQEYIKQVTIKNQKIGILLAQVKKEKALLAQLQLDYIEKLKAKILKKFLSNQKEWYKYDPEYLDAVMSLAGLASAQTEIHISTGVIKYFNKRLNKLCTL